MRTLDKYGALALLGGALLLGSVSGGAARADEPAPDKPAGVQAVVRVNGYTDNDHNEIITPLTAVSGQLGDEGQVTLGASVTYDIMTCASVDVVSAATPHGYFSEIRQEYQANTAVKLGLWTISGGGTYSKENDYSSISGSLGISTELFQRNTTLSLGYGFTGSSVGRANDPGFDRSLDSHTISATVTQVLSKSLVGQLTYFVGVFDGFQSSPYRLARVATGVAMPENVPNHRLRQSVVARINAALAAEHFLSLAYRLYGDDWGLLSHTAELGWTYEISRAVSFNLRDRVYLQGSTDFYSYIYDQPRTYMTNDRELGAFLGNTVGAKLSWAPDIGRTTKLALDLKFDFTYQRFDDFAALPTRLLYMGEIGATLDF
ncbi:MAG: DUF3570 domain-containing protein [Deltaproteobacteria bacterium]|nr:DUF3570 domain-containing protein [Deltaproteobacteria bacterium]